jgi:hypothetical protein
MNVGACLHLDRDVADLDIPESRRCSEGETAADLTSHAGCSPRMTLAHVMDASRSITLRQARKSLRKIGGAVRSRGNYLGQRQSKTPRPELSGCRRVR